MGERIPEQQEIIRAKFVSAAVTIATVLGLVVLIAIVKFASGPHGNGIPLWPLIHIVTISAACNTTIQETGNFLTIKRGNWEQLPETISKIIIPIGVLAIVIRASAYELHWTAFVGTAPALAVFQLVRKMVPLKRIIESTDDTGKD